MTDSAATVDGASPLLPYLSPLLASRAVERLRALRCFTEIDYLEQQPDVRLSGADPVNHALLFGATEGRALFKRETVARVLGQIVVEQRDESVTRLSDERTSLAKLASTIRTVNLYVSSRASPDTGEIAAGISENLGELGIESKILNEASDMRLSCNPSIFISPHEFFALQAGQRWLCDEILESAVVYNTARPHDPSFGKVLPVLLTADGVMDISSQSAHMLAEAGVRAMHWEPGVSQENTLILSEVDLLHPLMRVLPKEARIPHRFEDWNARPIEISFFDAASPRRDYFLSRFAKSFAEFETCIYLQRQTPDPESLDPTRGSLANVFAHVSHCSKITLNIQGDEFNAFDWHRMIRHGAACGALVITDPCMPHPSMKPGVHFLEESARHIPNLVEWVLRTEEGLTKAVEVVANATRLVHDGQDRTDKARLMLEFLMNNRPAEAS